MAPLRLTRLAAVLAVTAPGLTLSELQATETATALSQAAEVQPQELQTTGTATALSQAAEAQPQELALSDAPNEEASTAAAASAAAATATAEVAEVADAATAEAAGGAAANAMELAEPEVPAAPTPSTTTPTPAASLRGASRRGGDVFGETCCMCSALEEGSTILYGAGDFTQSFGTHAATSWCQKTCEDRCHSRGGRMFGCYDEQQLLSMEKLYGQQAGYQILRSEHLGNIC